jgi:hypothetical protein
MSYTTKMGRDFLLKRMPIPHIPSFRWRDYLPQGSTFRWKSNWDSERTSREAGLIWQTWLRAVAVNEWQARIYPSLDTSCPMCPNGVKELVIHRFWDWPQSKQAWAFAIYILSNMHLRKKQLAMFEAKYAIFSFRLPRRFQDVSRIWQSLRSVVLWSVWIARNDIVFNHVAWSQQRMRGIIWSSLFEYGRLAWLKVQNAKSKEAQTQALDRFDSTWTQNEFLSHREGMWCTGQSFISTQVDSLGRVGGGGVFCSFSLCTPL